MTAGYYQKKLGRYDYYEVISALRKEIKLGRTEDAIYWLHILLTYGEGGAKTAAKQLWIMACEDVFDEQIVLRAFAVFQMATKVTETDHLYFLTARMCAAKKWWEVPEGKMVDYLWSKAIGDLKQHPKPIPSYSLDEHTARGARAKNQGKTIDSRFSGHDYGRQQTAYLYERDNKITPESELDDQFFVYWKQYQDLMGEADQPVGVEQQSLISGERP